MKKKKKKIKGVIFVLPTFLCMLLMSILPLLFSMINSKTINSKSFEILVLVLVIIFVALLFLGFLEAIYCIIDASSNKKVKKKDKKVWYITLFLFNIFLVPYYYYKFIKKDKNFELLKKVYMLMLMLFCILSVVTTNTLIETYQNTTKKETKIKKEKKKNKENVRNIFSSKDNKFQMSFKLGFEHNDTSEYDLYAKDENRNLVTGAFFYTTDGFEEKTAEAVLNKQAEFIKNSRSNVEVHKNISNRLSGDKTIYSIELSGKNEDSSDCIYKLSTVSFANKENIVVYVIQVVVKDNYDDYINELDDIVNSLKLK